MDENHGDVIGALQEVAASRLPNTTKYAGSSTVGGGSKFLETFYTNSTTDTYGADWNFLAQWITNDRLKFKVINNGAIQSTYPIEVDHAYKLATSSTGSTAAAAPLSVGSETQPVYFSGGVPVATRYTLEAATTSTNGLMSSTDKTKLDNTNIAYGTCATAAATAAKVVTVAGNTNWVLKNGSLITVLFSATNTAESPTLNVNGTGAKNIYYGSAQITTSSLGYGGTANRPMNFMYDGTQYRFIGWGYDANTTYTNVKLGQGYATCSTAAATTAKVASLSSYTLTAGGIVSVRFTYDVPANATLNINSKGAKAIYYRNAAITAGVIKAGDTATFIYSTYYRLIAIDRWQEDIKAIQTALDGKASTAVATTSAAGLMSAADKTKLDGIDTGATKYSIKASSGVGRDTATLRYYTYESGGTPKYSVAAKTKNDTNAWGLTGTINATTPELSYTWYKNEDQGTWGGEVRVITAGNLANGSTIGAVKTTSTVTSTSGLTACPIISGVPYYKGYSLPTASSSTLGGVKIGSNISISNGVISVPTASGTTAGVTVVYPAASCTTFSSDSGTVTPLAVQKGAKMFAIPRITSTNKAITRYSGTAGEVQNSTILIEDVTNTRNDEAAQVISVPAASGTKKMVYGYCTDQIDGTSFIGGLFDADATEFPYSSGLAIGGSSGNLLWKGNRVLDTRDLTAYAKKPVIYTASITTTWSGSAAPYTQDITISGILAADTPLVDLTPSSTYATAQQQLADWGKIYRIVTAANKITVYATDKTTTALPIQLQVVR